MNHLSANASHSSTIYLILRRLGRFRRIFFRYQSDCLVQNTKTHIHPLKPCPRIYTSLDLGRDAFGLRILTCAKQARTIFVYSSNPAP